MAPVKTSGFALICDQKIKQRLAPKASRCLPMSRCFMAVQRKPSPTHANTAPAHHRRAAI
jgi:hypothetical protein